MKRFCLLLDLKDDPELIRKYEEWHRQVWPEVVLSIRESGILNMEIFRHANRLVMLMETEDDFEFSEKAERDALNETVQEWEKKMDEFQRRLPGSKPGEKWIVADRIFELSNF